MKEKGPRSHVRLYLGILIALALVLSPPYLVNEPGFQKWGLRQLNRLIQPWTLSAEKLRINLFRFKVSAQAIELRQLERGHRFYLEEPRIRVSPLRLIGGELAIAKLSAKKFQGVIPKKTPGSKVKRQFSLKRMLFLEKIRVQEARVSSVEIALPGEKNLKMATARVSFVPTFFRGGKKLGLQIQNASLDPWKLDALQIDGEIDRDQWLLHKLSLNLGGRTLEASGRLDMQTEGFVIDVETPEAIIIPEVGPPWRTFHSAGALQAKIKLEGTGFSIEKSEGQGSAVLSHNWDVAKSFPASLELSFSWKGGRLMIERGVVSSESKKIAVGGEITLSPLNFNLDLNAEEFPLERVFEKFVSVDLKPIRGLATAKGKLTGLPKEILFQIDGEASDAGYGPFAARKAVVNLTLGRDAMRLDGKLPETGEAHLVIHYGPKVKEGPRPKTLELEVSVASHPLEEALPNYHLKGRASGKLKLTGTPAAPTGNGEITLADGSFYGEPFEKIITPFQINQRHLLFGESIWIIPSLAGPLALKPFAIDFLPGAIRIMGKPLDPLSLDITYRTQEKRWDIEKLQVSHDHSSTPDFKTFGKVWADTQMQIQMIGKLPMAPFKALASHVREAAGTVDMDLKFTGSFFQPLLQGSFEFLGNPLSLKAYPYSFENIQGKLRFTGEKISSEKLTANLGGGELALKGSITQRGWRPHSYDLQMRGASLFWRHPKGDFRMEFDSDLTFNGPADSPTLTGDLGLIDASYTKDFNLLQEVKEGVRAPMTRREEEVGPPMKLNLRVKSVGELRIDNNVGKIGLTANLAIRGTERQPKFEGTVEVVSGKVKYLGMEFEIVRGFLELRDLHANPYLEVVGEKEIDINHITLVLRGRTDNLTVELAGTSPQGPLDKADAISLITAGVTKQELEAKGGAARRVASGLLAEQLSLVVGRPVQRATGLDVFRLEASPQAQGRISKIYLGKNLTDRLVLEFSMDTATERATQAFRAEYWLTDYLIFKGGRRSNESYDLNLGLRFRSR